MQPYEESSYQDTPQVIIQSHSLPPSGYVVDKQRSPVQSLPPRASTSGGISLAYAGTISPQTTLWPWAYAKLARKPIIGRIEKEIDFNRYHWAEPIEEYYWHYPVNHIAPVGPGPRRTYQQKLRRIVATARQARIRQELEQAFTSPLSTRSKIYHKGRYSLRPRSSRRRN